MLTQQILPIWKNVIRTGLDEHLNPDGVARFGDVEVHLEMDMGNEDIGRDIRPQMKKYSEAEAYNVWFAPSKTRIEALMRVANRWSMFSECGSRVWYDVSGNRLDIWELIHTRSA